MLLINKLLTITDTNLSLYDQKKANQLNVICAYCSVLAILLAILNAYLQRYGHLLLDIGLIGIVFFPVIIIQKQKLYMLARFYFTFQLLIIITGNCIYNISSGEFLQTENAFLMLAPTVVILYEKTRRVIIYMLTVVIFFIIHTYDFTARDLSLGSEFYSNSMIYLAVFLAIYLFVGSYKDAFHKIYFQQLKLIKQLREQKDELERTNETKNKLFSIVAHDLKRPVHMLTGLLEMEGLIPEAELKSYRKQVKENVESINSLIENVLTWARSQLEGFSINLKKTELSELFSNEIGVYKEQAEIKGIEFTADIPKNLQILSDPNHVSLVVRNIVNNSIKFTPAHGKISLCAEARNNQVIIIIKDSGIGMDDEMIDNIQSQKFVSSTQGTHGEKGSGLGLVLCTETLGKLGGQLMIKSKKDYGSKFIIQLPLN
ncbi:HAMP domain-containing sensor histidine kinase [Ekhidna sp.]|uniref:sensor histidine kinase n=1 Tax=Ekhidna sp. TaxID=2608089 RepID=UPI003298E74D